MKISENILLAKYTTFKIGGPARFFCVVKDEDELVQAVKFAQAQKNSGAQVLPILILGGGSNMLVSDAGFGGLVIKNEIAGIKISDDSVTLTAGAGESWDGLVEYAASHELFGLENLSAIPGTVGAAPVQNIGAYGAEAAQTISNVRALDTKAMKFVELLAADCKFGYRDSIFKQDRGHYIVTQVTFKLLKKGVLKMDYKDVREYFDTRNVTSPALVDLRKAIIEIRASKLPDWKVWGTAGSFFKNPSVSAAKFEELKAKYPELPGYPEDDGSVKVSLGWILDKVCDARGLTIGNVATYGNQALVVVAKSGATATEVLTLSQDLMRRVKDKMGIVIEAEVEWVC
ncbi:MAG: UDP-N-acetylmuramate dehydrogenase [Candidatus Taylorbacteria bacterium]